MKKTTQFSKVFLYQSLGFLVIIGLSWLNSLFGLPSILFESRFAEVDIETPVLHMLLILTVWLFVSSATRRNLNSRQ